MKTDFRFINPELFFSNSRSETHVRDLTKFQITKYVHALTNVINSIKASYPR